MGKESPSRRKEEEANDLWELNKLPVTGLSVSLIRAVASLSTPSYSSKDFLHIATRCQVTFLGRCEQTSVHLRTNDRPNKRPHIYHGKTTEFSGVERAWVA